MANRITINPGVLVGKQVIRNTRIPVYLVLNLIANGALPASHRFGDESFVGGGQIGYNYQFTPGSGKYEIKFVLNKGEYEYAELFEMKDFGIFIRLGGAEKTQEQTAAA